MNWTSPVTTAEEIYGGMMIDRASFKKSLENAAFEALKKRDKLILEICRYEKDKELRECDFF